MRLLGQALIQYYRVLIKKKKSGEHQVKIKGEIERTHFLTKKCHRWPANPGRQERHGVGSPPLPSQRNAQPNILSSDLQSYDIHFHSLSLRLWYLVPGVPSTFPQESNRLKISGNRFNFEGKGALRNSLGGSCENLRTRDIQSPSRETQRRSWYSYSLKTRVLNSQRNIK